MRIPVLELIWTGLMISIGYGLYNNISQSATIKTELVEVTEKYKLQEETIKQLQIDFLRVADLANKNAEAYERVTKDTSSNKVQKVTISNLQQVKKNIKGRLNVDDSKFIDNNVSIELNRLWNEYKDNPTSKTK